MEDGFESAVVRNRIFYALDRLKKYKLISHEFAFVVFLNSYIYKRLKLHNDKQISKIGKEMPMKIIRINNATHGKINFHERTKICETQSQNQAHRININRGLPFCNASLKFCNQLISSRELQLEKLEPLEIVKIISMYP